MPIERLWRDLQEILKAGIIEPSKSGWSFPIVFVKKDGGFRLCVDYWRLNTVTAVDTYPMLRIDNLSIGWDEAPIWTSLVDIGRSPWQRKINQRRHSQPLWLSVCIPWRAMARWTIALQLLDRLKESNTQLTRWSLVLHQYDFTVEHHTGVKNANADGLSRML